MRRAALKGVCGAGQGPFWIGLMEALRAAGFYVVQVGSHGYPIRDGNKGSVGVRLHVKGCLPVFIDARYELPPKQNRAVPAMVAAHEVVLRYEDLRRSLATLEREAGT